MKNKATQTGAIFGLAMIAIIAAVTTIAVTPEANADSVRRGKATRSSQSSNALPTNDDFRFKSPVMMFSATGGSPCPEDIDGNGSVDFSDVLGLLAGWGTCTGCPEDVNHDGNVDFADLLALLAAWGDCP